MRIWKSRSGILSNCGATFPQQHKLVSVVRNTIRSNKRGRIALYVSRNYLLYRKLTGERQRHLSNSVHSSGSREPSDLGQNGRRSEEDEKKEGRKERPEGRTDERSGRWRKLAGRKWCGLRTKGRTICNYVSFHSICAGNLRGAALACVTHHVLPLSSTLYLRCLRCCLYAVFHLHLSGRSVFSPRVASS